MARSFGSIVASACLVMACGAPERPAPVVVPPPPAPVPAVVEAPLAQPPRPPSRAIMLGGSNEVANAAWVPKGVVAVTRTDVWRFAADKPDHVRITALAGTINAHDVIAAHPTSSLLAVALDDSSIDLLDDDGRKRTLPPPAKPSDVLALRFSPDQTAIAVTRTGASWKEETTFYEVATGNVIGQVEGGNVVFDATGKYIAARGGLFTVDGKAISKFKEGFHVLGLDGKRVPMDGGGQGEVMAGDFVARGFVGDVAFFAGEKAVELVATATGTVTSIDASCAPGSKLGSEADPDNARVIGLCHDGVLLTDIKTRKTTKVKAPVQKQGFSVPDVFLPRHSLDFVVRGSGMPHLFVQGSGTARVATAEESRRYQERSTPATCANRRTPRTAIPCDIPGERGDGAFKLHVERGLTIHDRAGKKLIDWTTPVHAIADRAWTFRHGALELRAMDTDALVFRLDGAAPRSPTSGTVFSAAGCGTPSPKSDWRLRASSDAFAAYSNYKSAGGYVTAELICVCRAEGCTTSELPNSHRLAESLVAVGEDGATLSISTNPTMTETEVYVRRAKKPALRAKLPASCIYGTFGPDRRVYMACEAGERATVYELAPKDLAVVAKRSAPPIGRRIRAIHRAGDDIVIHVGDTAALLSADWVKDPSLPVRATLAVAPSYAIALGHDGKVTIAGDHEAAAGALRCYDGTHLRPFADCRSEAMGLVGGLPR